jgi:hypothetical protein
MQLVAVHDKLLEYGFGDFLHAVNQLGDFFVRWIRPFVVTCVPDISEVLNEAPRCLINYIA